MPSFTTQCPSCGSALRLGQEYAGHEARCGRCGAVFVASPTDDPPWRATPIPPPRRDPDYRGRDDDRYEDDDRPSRRRRSKPSTDAGGTAVTALVLGIIAALTWPCPPVGLITGGIAVVVGGGGLASRSRGAAVTGIVLGLAGVVFSLGCGVLYGVAIQQENQANRPGGNRPPFVHGAD